MFYIKDGYFEDMRWSIFELCHIFCLLPNTIYVSFIHSFVHLLMCSFFHSLLLYPLSENEMKNVCLLLQEVTGAAIALQLLWSLKTLFLSFTFLRSLNGWLNSRSLIFQSQVRDRVFSLLLRDCVTLECSDTDRFKRKFVFICTRQMYTNPR